MTKVELHGLLVAGHTITNIGQFSKKASEWVREAIKRGDVEVFTVYTFPNPKKAYRWASA